MMKHSTIYEKFKIEYDKANITSSYPSLTDYEIATILDKAYLALIAQKFTGNNKRGVAFEADIKAIEDIKPLLNTTEITITDGVKYRDISNSIIISTNIRDLLYYVNGTLSIDSNIYNIQLINHLLAPNFFKTGINNPWIKTPVGFFEDNDFIILYDEYKHSNPEFGDLHITYMKIPTSFVDSVNNKENVDFELSSTVAEELINLAIIMSLETVESPRLQTKLETSSLES